MNLGPKPTLWERGQNPEGDRIEGLARIPLYDEIYGKPRSIPWLWEPYLARGTLAILDGDPGVGKSLITIDLLARVLDNRPMPDGSPSHTGPDQWVVYTNNEDHQDLTVMPRIAATKCFKMNLLFFGGISDVSPPMKPAQFPHDWKAFTRFVRSFRPPLIVLDSFSSILAPAICANHDQSIRQVLTPMAELAAETESCILFIRHPTKTQSRASLYRGAGSVAIVGTMRTALYAGRHPTEPDTFVLGVSKSNLGKFVPSLKYRIVTKQTYLFPENLHGPPAPMPSGPGIEWLGTTPHTTRDLDGPERQSILAQAVIWLNEQLRNGPVPALDLYDRAATLGIPERTLRSAKDKSGIKSKRIGEGEKPCWVWEKGK